ncbi:MAG TPA: hypothetical protein VEP69_00785, partial [Thermodesulfovibrionales bacterium]|nr:hypothetical protein [Thermodesulfovibrionales bacterium]
SGCLVWLFLFLYALSLDRVFLASAVITGMVNIAVNRQLISAFFRAKGLMFGILATLYYCLVYPWPVIAGGLSGTLVYFQSRRAVP